MAIVVIVAVMIAHNFGKDGPAWKAPLIAGVIFFIALFVLEMLGFKPQ
jgi:hypothetical protein